MTDSNPTQNYKKPPITEAIIELRLEAPIEEKAIQKIQRKLSKDYEYSKTILKKEFSLDTEEMKISEVRQEVEFEGFMLTSKNECDVVQIKRNAMICSRLAPYTGWENFAPRARKNWGIWRKSTKKLRLSRIGVRYINRIDIPIKERKGIRLEDYLTVVPQYPEPSLIKVLTNYTMQITGSFSAENFQIVVNTNVTRSPLIDHLSVILDIDLSPQDSLPQSDDNIWHLVDEIREHKNNAFEMCITDLTRELFSR